MAEQYKKRYKTCAKCNKRLNRTELKGLSHYERPAWANGDIIYVGPQYIYWCKRCDTAK